ncbi:MAG: hypothetical protein V7731_18835 [Amphritea sp.]
MKSITLLVLFLLALGAHASDTITYDSEYYGLQVGKSTAADVIDLLGYPIEKKSYSNNVKYIFNGIHVTIQDRTGRINTIIIFENDYTDTNGIWVGSNKEEVEYRLNIYIDSDVVVDKVNGIVYWFENGQVSKIVLAHKLRL